jgi:Na+-transporting NADH:ubiquinone oxidoreductase subunit C
MNKESNSYTFFFTVVMIVIVALGLSFTALTLKPYQERNKELETKVNILQSVNLNPDFENAENEFDKYITKILLVKNDGSYTEGNGLNINIKEELKKPEKQRILPLFISHINGGKYYIIPLYGKGLWGPIWGYISLKEDLNTVYGVSFGHKSETPGLGAKIVADDFRNQFRGKKIFDDNGNFTSILVEKNLRQLNEHQVDAISGATLTSKGVQRMLKDVLSHYLNFFRNLKNNKK